MKALTRFENTYGIAGEIIKTIHGDFCIGDVYEVTFHRYDGSIGKRIAVFINHHEYMHEQMYGFDGLGEINEHDYIGACIKRYDQWEPNEMINNITQEDIKENV